MDRTVPRLGSDEIELYMRTYYSLLRSTGEIQLEALVEAHANMDSSLHPKARSLEPDMDALTYTTLRLPDCIFEVRLVVLGQSQDVFIWRKYPAVESWQEVSAIGRRRRMFFDGKETLAAYIASRSDIDDLIPMLTAFQIEWNKLHHLLQGNQIRTWLAGLRSKWLDDEELAVLATGMGVPYDGMDRLRGLWSDKLPGRLLQIAAQRKSLSLHLLDSSLAAYRKAIRRWWANIEEHIHGIERLERPVFFVSSNPHSLPNLLAGWALEHEAELADFMRERMDQPDLVARYERLKAEENRGELQNLLYFAKRAYLAAEPAARLEVMRAEEAVGIQRVSSRHSFDVEAQVIRLDQLDPARFDPRIQMPGLDGLRGSETLIINIDYPLGMASYQILSEIARNIHYFKGIYMLGKAATLNGRIGDVMAPNVVYDEHSRNTYLFPNCFTAAHLSPYMVCGTVMDNQKAITVRGTFLQNPRFMTVIYEEGYTDIEMEAGPYLSAVTESIRPNRHPYDEIVNLYGAPFDIGIVHYASDKPLGRGKNLGTQGLSYQGMESTYAGSIAILRRLFQVELSE
jgi:hypothetical protein